MTRSSLPATRRDNPARAGQVGATPRSDRSGPGAGLLPEPGPTSDLGRSPRIVPHRHGANWNLCDRSYSPGQAATPNPRDLREVPPDALRSRVPFRDHGRRAARLKPGSFDLVYLDPPYGTTSADWDRVPDWNWLGSEVARLLRPNGQAVLHGAGAMALEAAATFLGELDHRFQIVWVKGRTGGPLRSSPWLSDFEPLRAHEMIHVFKRKEAKTGDLTFNLGAMHRRGKPWHAIKWKGPAHHGSYPIDGREYSSDGWRYPVDVVFSLPATEGDLFAQKPEDLVTLLLATLTRAGDSGPGPLRGLRNHPEGCPQTRAEVAWDRGLAA